jgi:hypothetical protein
MLISSSDVYQKAHASGVTSTEVTDCGEVVGIQIGDQIVRHNGAGWYEALDVDAAIGPENIPVSLVGIKDLWGRDNEPGRT